MKMLALVDYDLPLSGVSTRWKKEHPGVKTPQLSGVYLSVGFFSKFALLPTLLPPKY